MQDGVEKHAQSCYKNHIKPMMDKIDKLDEKVGNVSLKLAELPKDLADEFDKRYASKETEVAMKRIMWIVIVAVVTAVLALVIKS